MIAAVERLACNSEKLLQLVDGRVMEDYDGFVDVVEQYCRDADSMYSIISEFSKNTLDISNNMEGISKGLDDISTAVSDNANGIVHVAENAVELVNSLKEIQSQAESNEGISHNLNSEVMKFKNIG